MAEFPYTPNPASLKRFLGQVKTVGIPSKVTMKWIEGLGFKSGNDRYILGILKSLKFTDASGVPNKQWTAFRHKEQGRVVMAGAIREAYGGLFETYPDAHRKADEALRNFFSTHTDVGAKAISLMVRTFKSLTEFADFDAAAIPLSRDVDRPATEAQTHGKPTAQVQLPSATGLTINVNIQLQLPATEDAAIYDKLFEALKKHILS